jgi:hypothetical protein
VSDEARRILELLATGKMTVDEAAQLLHLVQEQKTGDVPADEASAPKSAGAGTPDGEGRRFRFLRIAVHKDGSIEKDVDIRIPLTLVRGGMRIGAFVPGLGDTIADHLRERGIDFSEGDFDPNKLDELLKDLGELRIDVDKGREQVRIRCE